MEKRFLRPTSTTSVQLTLDPLFQSKKIARKKLAGVMQQFLSLVKRLKIYYVWLESQHSLKENRDFRQADLDCDWILYSISTLKHLTHKADDTKSIQSLVEKDLELQIITYLPTDMASIFGLIDSISIGFNKVNSMFKQKLFEENEKKMIGFLLEEAEERIEKTKRNMEKVKSKVSKGLYS